MLTYLIEFSIKEKNFVKVVYSLYVSKILQDIFSDNLS